MRWVVIIALFALVPRFLIPAGYMPVAAKTFTVMLCSGEASVTVDLGQTKTHDDGKGSDHPQCAFSAAATPLLSGTPPVFAAIALDYIIRHGPAAIEDQSPAGFIRLRPPLRGPPVA